MRALYFALGISLLAVTAGCVISVGGGSSPSTTSRTETIRTTTTEQTRIPATYNDVMVALVNSAADPIWRAAWDRPRTEATWRELERNAYQLKLAGALLQIPGEGPGDAAWASDPRWSDWSRDLEDAGNASLAAIRSRDAGDIQRAGDLLVEVCEGCHIDFKAAMPTGGKFGELSPTPSMPEGRELPKEPR